MNEPHRAVRRREEKNVFTKPDGVLEAVRQSSNLRMRAARREPLTLLPIAILAGGLGTRLRPVTERIPKALVEVSGRPFIEYQLDLLRAAGITDVVMCVSFLGEMLEAHVGDGRSYGMNVRYSYDGPDRIGTAGAIKKAIPMLGERFFVTYGDSYLRADYPSIQNAALQAERPALMTVYRNGGAGITSNVLYREGRIVAYDKDHPLPEMRHVDFGLSVFHADRFERVSTDRPTDLGIVFQALIAEGDLAGFEVAERFLEVGTPAGIAEMEGFLRSAGAPS
jgi:NDP-sugar pyrophosphorylase family protein